MNENDYSHTSDWYSTSGAASFVPTIPKKKKHTALIVLICVGAFLVLAVFAGLLVYGAGQAVKTYSGSASSDASGLPDDWHDFFDKYYGGTGITKADIQLGKTQYSGSFSLSLDASSPQKLTLQQIYAKCRASVVTITAKEADSQSASYMGTGIVLSADGLIVTNTHIIDGCDKATVELYDGTEYDAKLIGADSQSDVTVLKIEASGLTPAQFADSDGLQVGDSVVAIGNPLGNDLTGTMTNGIVSAINRGITYNGHSMTLIQTNAAINEGNSGGPLIDMYGRVVGITNMKMMSSYSSIEGIGFAIPSSTVKSIADQLISGGSITGRPSIGITVGAVSEAASEHYGIPDGLYISDVVEGSDAKKQGIEKGDILTAVNGAEVHTTNDVSDIKNSCAVGDVLTLTIWRDGKTMDFDVTLYEASAIF